MPTSIALTDKTAFRGALLEALAARDAARLQAWMTDPFLTGAWRGELSETRPAEALWVLYSDQLGSINHLAPVMSADLKALLGGREPLSMAGERVLADAFLAVGWGKDGRDEAVLFVARESDNSLKWRGWMQIKGGFSGARLGGIQSYKNDLHGYTLFMPRGFTVSTPTLDYSVLVGPEPARVLAYLYVEAANGGTAAAIAEQAIDKAKKEMGPDWAVPVPVLMNIEGAEAVAVDGFPGQDLNRQLFMVHRGKLYRMVFVPDDPQLGDAYLQMQDAYAMIVNTFHFTN
ncbi:MAG: hypothetical protein ACM3JD_09215 [Rudaea sp.]